MSCRLRCPCPQLQWNMQIIRVGFRLALIWLANVWYDNNTRNEIWIQAFRKPSKDGLTKPYQSKPFHFPPPLTFAHHLSGALKYDIYNNICYMKYNNSSSNHPLWLWLTNSFQFVYTVKDLTGNMFTTELKILDRKTLSWRWNNVILHNRLLVPLW